MYKIFMLAAFCAAIAGCKQDQGSIQSDVEHAPKAAAASPVPEALHVSVEVRQPGATITIGGQAVVFPFEHVLRYDRVAVTRSQRKQRQAFFEVKKADATAVVAQVIDAMVAAGYKAGQPRDDKGGQRIAFRKKGALSVSVLVRPKTDKPRLKDPAATASVYLAVTERAAR